MCGEEGILEGFFFVILASTKPRDPSRGENSVAFILCSWEMNEPAREAHQRGLGWSAPSLQAWESGTGCVAEAHLRAVFVDGNGGAHFVIGKVTVAKTFCQLTLNMEA